MYVRLDGMIRHATARTRYSSMHSRHMSLNQMACHPSTWTSRNMKRIGRMRWTSMMRRRTASRTVRRSSSGKRTSHRWPVSRRNRSIEALMKRTIEKMSSKRSTWKERTKTPHETSLVHAACSMPKTKYMLIEPTSTSCSRGGRTGLVKWRPAASPSIAQRKAREARREAASARSDEASTGSQVSITSSGAESARGSSSSREAAKMGTRSSSCRTWRATSAKTRSHWRGTVMARRATHSLAIPTAARNVMIAMVIRARIKSKCGSESFSPFSPSKELSPSSLIEFVSQFSSASVCRSALFGRRYWMRKRSSAGSTTSNRVDAAVARSRATSSPPNRSKARPSAVLSRASCHRSSESAVRAMLGCWQSVLPRKSLRRMMSWS
mmetsp:Transcript_46668/g.107106  ORF Transcript_46668/g.107106 Transcript_46668/m.107106 type:complete len:381 (-) Transcript_46668:51-1193(-)